MISFFFFQAEDGIRDIGVTGVQTCALPIYLPFEAPFDAAGTRGMWGRKVRYCAYLAGNGGMTLSPGGRDAGLEWGSGGCAGGVAPARGRAAPGTRGHQCPNSGGIRRVGSRGRSAHLILQSKGVSMATEVRSAGSAEGPRLRRELHLWEAVGISLALMAPSMAANINPQGTATTIGRAVPLA